MSRIGAALVLAVALWPLGGKAHRETERGNHAYEEKDYDEALRAYTEAQVAAPDAPELHYDIGNVLYRRRDQAGAAEEYGRALASAPPTLQPEAAYNLGNALFGQEKYSEAVEAYTRALRADPRDRDAKHNLELALRAIEEKKQQQQKQQQQQPNQQQNQNQKQKQGGGSDQRSQGGGDRGGAAQKMTPEQAKQLLNGVSETERQAMRDEAARQARRVDTAVEEDW